MNKKTAHRKIKSILICLGLALVVQGFLVVSMIASSSAYWVWSLRLAINDLKFYPDQVFPALSYPVDYDTVTLPMVLNDFTVQIPQGAEITWINKDRNPSDEGEEFTIISHLIQVKDKNQKVVSQSPLLATWGQSFTARFDEARGVYLQLFPPSTHAGKVRGFAVGPGARRAKINRDRDGGR